ncbi:MAG: hypothetical protein R6U96_13765 [Promethearchaeia archaeon]
MKMKSFIFQEQNNNWIEEENVLYHDLVALLDKEDKTIYLWNGPQSSLEKLEKGKKSIDTLLGSIDNKKFTSSLDIQFLSKKIPSKIQKELKNLLSAIEKEEFLEQLKFTHFTTINGYFILSLITFILPLLSLGNLLRFLFWETSNGNYLISASSYSMWLDLSALFLFIAFLLFIAMLAIGFYEGDKKVMLFAALEIISSFGILLLFSQDIFIFLFQEGSTTTDFLISIKDIWVFFLLNLFAHLIIISLTTNRFFQFYYNYKDLIF